MVQQLPVTIHEPRDGVPPERFRQGARVEITAYFTDREPVGPYRITVPPRWSLHVRFNELEDSEPIPR